MQTYQILVVEDEDVTRFNLRNLFEAEGYTVFEAVDGDSMAEQLKQNTINLVIMDINLPGKNGLLLARELTKSKDLGLIFLTGRDSDIDKILGLEIGADDYLIKPFAFPEVLARVRTLIRRGGAKKIEDTLRIADLEMDIPKRKVQRAGKRITLSNKEFSLLELLLRREGEVLPRSIIASQVWDMNFDSDTNVIDVAIRRLRGKVDDDFSVKLIHTVRGMGYKLEVDIDEI